MSKSVPILKPLRRIGYAELLQQISDESHISLATVTLVIETLIEIITRSLLSGCAVNILNFFTFHLRRRDYSEERRRKFNMGHATLPEYCFYPYAEASQTLRKTISANKESINQRFNAPSPDLSPKGEA